MMRFLLLFLKVESLVSYARINGKQLILGCDSNAHHLSWGSTDTNERGVRVLDFISSNGLEFLNVGNEPTFVTSNRAEVLDITLVSPFLRNKIRDWRVSKEPSFSDHLCIEFSVSSLQPEKQEYRNPKRMNKQLFADCIFDGFDGSNVKLLTKLDMDRHANMLSAKIVQSFEQSCPLSTRISNRSCPWFTPRLMELRKLVRKLWNRSKKVCKKGHFNDPAVQVYRETLLSYNLEVKKAKIFSFQKHCEELNGYEEGARLFRLLSKGPTRTIGAIKRTGSDFFTESA
jgi:Endonuclease-reverse transcriptase